MRYCTHAHDGCFSSPLSSPRIFCTRKKRTEIPAFLGACALPTYLQGFCHHTAKMKGTFFFSLSVANSISHGSSTHSLVPLEEEKKKYIFAPRKLELVSRLFFFLPLSMGGKLNLRPPPDLPPAKFPLSATSEEKGERPKNWERMWADRGRKKKKKRTSLFCPPLVCTVPLWRSRSSVPKARSLFHISCLFPSLPPSSSGGT